MSKNKEKEFAGLTKAEKKNISKKLGIRAKKLSHRHYKKYFEERG